MTAQPDLAGAVATVRDRAAAPGSGSTVPGADAARAARAELVGQLDDYLLPRLRRLDAPLLAVVGGSTGAGKSTLVNTPGRRGGQPGRGAAPDHPRRRCCVCHPADARWFAGRPRAARPGPDGRHGEPGGAGPCSWSSGTRPCRPGWPCSTRPDIDSVVDANRALAAPAARRRRPLALRHHGRPVRRRRALGPAAHRRRSAAPRWPSCSTACRREADGGDRGRPRPRCSTASGLGRARRCSSCRRAAGRRACCPTPGGAAARLAARAGRPTPTPGPPWSGRPWTARCDSLRAAGRRRSPRAVDEPAAAADGCCEDGGRPPTTRPRAGRRRGRPRRHAAARRGAGPLAGVRRHRRADARLEAPGRPAARPGGRARSPAGRRRREDLERGAGDQRRALVRAAADRPPSGPSTAWRGRAGRARPCSPTRPRAGARSPDFRRAAEREVRDWQGAVLELVRSRAAASAVPRPGSRPTASTAPGWW